MKLPLLSLAAAMLFATIGFPALGSELLMFRQKACEWCTAWDREIGAKYSLTEAGKAAPLRMVDIHAARAAGHASIKGIVFTPTFVVVRDGHELGRILGYPGEDFFWGLLEKILDDSSADGTGDRAALPPQTSANR